MPEKIINSKDNEGRGDAKGDQLGYTTAHLMIKAGVRTFFFSFGFAILQILHIKQAVLIFYTKHNYKFA